MGYRGLPARIRWGTSYTSALDIPDLDGTVSYPEPSDGSEYLRVPSAEDAWIVVDDDLLEFEARWIPTVESLSPKRASGWDGTATQGWRSALKWMRQKSTAKFHPNATNLVVSPLMSVDTDTNGLVDDFLSSIAAGHTAAFVRDAGELAQKITVSASAGAGFTYVYQNVANIMAGESITAACDVKCASLVGGARAFLNLNFHDSSGAFIAGNAGGTSTNTGGYSRITRTATAPAGSYYALAIVGFEAQAAGNTGIVFAKNFSMRRDGLTTYVDNPSIDVILQEPMKGAPPLENNKMRTLRVKLRAATAGISFDGY